MRNTITTNSKATFNYLNAADEIMSLSDELGFTSEINHDTEMIRHTIAQIIRENIEGNVTFTVAETVDDENIITVPEVERGCPCCEDTSLDKILEEIGKEKYGFLKQRRKCRSENKKSNE